MIGELPIGQPRLLGVVCGPMKSGKSEQLLRMTNRLSYQKNITYAVFKPAADSRTTNISSRNGTSADCQIFSDPKDLLNVQEQVILIDEGQFLPESTVEVICSLCRRGKHVVVFGLDLDRNKEVFGPMAALLAQADYVKKISAYCDVCGKPSRYSQYVGKDQTNKQILVGDKEYKAVCRNCYL